MLTVGQVRAAIEGLADDAEVIPDVDYRGDDFDDVSVCLVRVWADSGRLFVAVELFGPIDEDEE